MVKTFTQIVELLNVGAKTQIYQFRISSIAFVMLGRRVLLRIEPQVVSLEKEFHGKGNKDILSMILPRLITIGNCSEISYRHSELFKRI